MDCGIERTLHERTAMRTRVEITSAFGDLSTLNARLLEFFQHIDPNVESKTTRYKSIFTVIHFVRPEAEKKPLIDLLKDEFRGEINVDDTFSIPVQTGE